MLSKMIIMIHSKYPTTAKIMWYFEPSNRTKKVSLSLGFFSSITRFKIPHNFSTRWIFAIYNTFTFSKCLPQSHPNLNPNFNSAFLFAIQKTLTNYE